MTAFFLLLFLLLAVGYLFYRHLYKKAEKEWREEAHTQWDTDAQLQENEQDTDLQVSKTFGTKVVGVSFDNPDGTSRQKIIKKCKTGEKLHLVRDPDNPYGHGTTIKVLRKSGEQIGHIATHVSAGLSYFMDRGGPVEATILKKVGGSGREKTLGCVIQVAKGLIPYQVKEQEAIKLIQKAGSLEETDPDEAVLLYKEAIRLLGEVDHLVMRTYHYQKTKKSLRKTRYPINRLTMVLEKKQKYKECLDAIKNYEQIDDEVGLTKTDRNSIGKRKVRIDKKVSVP